MICLLAGTSRKVTNDVSVELGRAPAKYLVQLDLVPLDLVAGVCQ
jgi:hypothetical protein